MVVARDGRNEARPAGLSLPVEDPLIGTCIGSYRIVELIGCGGMGAVYRVEHEVMGASAALKVLRPDLAPYRELVERFVDEARAAARIRHPNTIQIYDLVRLADGRPAILMELVIGESLEERLRGGSVPRAQAIDILAQVCDALEAAHAQGIVHRDVKTDNVLLVTDGDELVAKVFDFGIAKLRPIEAGLTMPGTVMGTPFYMAPEQVMGRDIDARADIYAVGVLAYRLLVGEYPYDGDSPTAIMLKHVHAPVPDPVGLPPAVRAVLRRALAKDPNDRFQDCEGLARAFRDAASAEAGRPPAPRGPRGPEPFAVSPPRVSAPVVVALQLTEPEMPSTNGLEPSGGPERVATPPAAEDIATTWPETATSSPPSEPETAEPAPALPFEAVLEGDVLCVRFRSVEDYERIDADELSKRRLWVPREAPVATGGIVKLRLRAPGLREAEVSAKVVLTADREQAERWGLAPGFALEVSKRPVLEPRPPADDRAVALLVDEFERRLSVDSYAFLSVAQDATAAEIGEAIGRIASALDAAGEPDDGELRARLGRVRDGLERARRILGNPEARARRDAGEGNFRGVARAIEAGLSPDRLEYLHRAYQAKFPERVDQAAPIMCAVEACLLAQNRERAVELVLEALALDPLNPTLQRRFAAANGLQNRSRAPGPARRRGEGARAS